MRWLLAGGIPGLLCVAAGLYTMTAKRPVVLLLLQLFETILLRH